MEIIPQILGYYDALLLLLHIPSTGYSHSVKINYNTTQTMKRCIKANIVIETAGGESAVLLTSS